MWMFVFLSSTSNFLGIVWKNLIEESCKSLQKSQSRNYIAWHLNLGVLSFCKYPLCFVYNVIYNYKIEISKLLLLLSFSTRNSININNNMYWIQKALQTFQMEILVILIVSFYKFYPEPFDLFCIDLTFFNFYLRCNNQRSVVEKTILEKTDPTILLDYWTLSKTLNLPIMYWIEFLAPCLCH